MKKIIKNSSIDDEKSMEEKLIDEINKAANLISQRSRTNDGNFMIVSPKIADVILDTVDYQNELNINTERYKKLKDILNDEKLPDY